MKGLNEKAVILTLNISQFTAKKEDKKATREINTKYNVTPDSGKYQKVLLAKEALKEINRIATQARLFHYENTLPWNDAGGRLLPIENYFDYTGGMNKFKEEFTNAMEEFVTNYSTYVEDSKSRLGGLFNINDYPPPSTIANKFDFNFYIDPLPDVSDFRINLNGEEVEKIQKELEERIANVTTKSIKDLWMRLHKSINHIIEILSDEDSRLHKTLIGNLIDLTELLPKLNITNDPDLDNMRKEVEKKLTTFSMDEIKEDTATRMSVVQSAKDILSTIDKFI